MSELLAPCGNMKTLKAAVSAGADAVYSGTQKFSARAFADNFSADELFAAVAYAAKFGVKIYLAVNTLITDREMKEALEVVMLAHNAGVAAFIVQDAGLAAEIKKAVPDAALHASTQMTARTAKDVTALANMGFKRVVLARELSREQIRAIAQNADAELEVFVHGALCSSYSGQCLMSSFIGGRSANRGKCAAPCRLTYKGEKKSGTLLSLRDLCLIDYIGELADMGITSLKIEGRMKGEDYVRAVVGAYRTVLDGEKLSEQKRAKMLNVFNRGGYTDGYYTNCGEMYTSALKNPYKGKASGKSQALRCGKCKTHTCKHKG
ncbi:MAG: U32 family peptidase [Defluviitaleaceae bacterium]|nr:U32 family peptidase [Defluviitaleaceae bacterium]